VRLSGCRNISDLRRLAARRLPAPIFHFADGGSDDELSLRENCAAFERWRLVPEYLVDVDRIDTQCRVLGKQASIPLMLSPTACRNSFTEIRDGSRCGSGEGRRVVRAIHDVKHHDRKGC
jgi:L-lactate dehydrogenase (cytochrome)